MQFPPKITPARIYWIAGAGCVFGTTLTVALLMIVDGIIYWPTLAFAAAVWFGVLIGEVYRTLGLIRCSKTVLRAVAVSDLRPRDNV